MIYFFYTWGKQLYTRLTYRKWEYVVFFTVCVSKERNFSTKIYLGNYIQLKNNFQQENIAKKKIIVRHNPVVTEPNAFRWMIRISAPVLQDSQESPARTTRMNADISLAYTENATTHTEATRKSQKDRHCLKWPTTFSFLPSIIRQKVYSIGNSVLFGALVLLLMGCDGNQISFGR